MNIPINFNIIDYLNKKGVQYATSGKNKIRSAVAVVSCPFHDDSHSKHLNLFQDGWCKCWHCGSININRYIKEIEQIQYHEVPKIVNQFPLDCFYDQNEINETQESPIIHPIEFKIPSEFKTTFPEKHRKYLEERNFNWQFLRNKYKLMTSYTDGDYAFRIIIPIIMNNKIVSFIGRDITGKQKLKYKNYPDRLSLIPREDWVFNIDNIKGDTCIICEGSFDAMRLGDGAISFLTTNYTKSQLLQLKNKNIKSIYILYDNDEAGIQSSEKLAQELSWAEEVNFIDLPKGINDPAELSESQVQEIRRNVF